MASFYIGDAYAQVAGAKASQVRKLADESKEHSLKGKVYDEVDGQPMPGVAVQIEGTSQGMATDIDGNFTLPVGKACNIVFSFIGYKKIVLHYDGPQIRNL